MPEAIDELFVKLGLEQDQQQFDQAQDSFDNLRGAALQFGAVIGAGFGLNELTFDFARTTNEVNKLAEEFEGLGVTPQFVSDLRGAMQLLDRDVGEADSLIRGLADIIEDTDWGQVSDAAFARGLDLSGIQDAETAAQAMQALNEQLRNMDQERARRLSNALGLSSAQFDLLRNTNVQQAMEEAEAFRPLTNEMTEAARDFQQGYNELALAMDGLSKELSADFVGDLGSEMSDVADLIAENRDAVADFADEAMPVLKGMAASLAILVGLRGGKAALALLAGSGGAALGALSIGGAYGFFAQENKERRNDPNKQTFLEAQQNPDTFYDAITRPTMLGKASSLTGYASNALFGDDVDRGAFTRSPDRDLLPRYGIGNIDRRGDTYINVDARGATNPDEVRKAAERGAQEALNQSSENTARDLQPRVQ